jgi:hypothetical protein
MHFVPPPLSIPNPKKPKSKQEVDLTSPFVLSMPNPKLLEAAKNHP